MTQPVAIYDVKDAQRFVAAAVHRLPFQLDQNEIEELIAEGQAILVELSNGYTSHRDGYDQPGRFSGYAAQYLPRRLIRAYHNLHETHYEARTTEGREWRQVPPPIRLDDPDLNHELPAVNHEIDDNEMPDLAAQAFKYLQPWNLLVIRRLYPLWVDGYKTSDIARETGMSTIEITGHREAFAEAIKTAKKELENNEQPLAA